MGSPKSHGGDRRGSRELAPQLFALLPDENRAYIVYRSHFNAQVEEDMERSFRLRLEEGWFDPQTADPPAVR